MMSPQALCEAANVLTRLTHNITESGVSAALNVGERRRSASAFLATSAAIGSLEVLASVIAANGPASVNNDVVLIAAFVVIASNSVSISKDKPGHVIVDSDYGPDSFATALSMFQKLTGRDGSTLLAPELVAAIKNGEQTGTDLLNQICANRKPI